MDLQGRGAMVTSAHVLAAAPNALILKHMDWWQSLFTEPLRLEKGCVVRSENPGIGLDLDRKALDRFKA
ncbi:MAG: enolase C-terminal domain-like protein [Candidatus Rokubacteria bacterium]|nr:enolase C-terminal domain-like protein [Candidatus Rokubacteria bacterium]